MARTVLTLLLLATTALAGPADSLTGVDMRQEYAARRQAVAEELGEGVLVLFAPPRRGYGTYRPDSNLFWLTGLCSIMGLAVDISAAVNTLTRLQTVADSASHAGVIDLFPISSGAVPSSTSPFRTTPSADGVFVSL